MIGLVLISVTVRSQSNESWAENFETYDSGYLMIESEGWTGFAGFRGDTKPTAAVLTGKGIDGSKALGILHSEAFRTDNWGLQF